MAPSQSDKKNQSGEKPKGKKICCACPETKVWHRLSKISDDIYSVFLLHYHFDDHVQKARDDCVTLHGPDSEECRQLIEDHKACLRAEGFNVRL